MPDYGDEPSNPSDILPLNQAVITLILNGDLTLLVAVLASVSGAGGTVLQVHLIRLIMSALISD